MNNSTSTIDAQTLLSQLAMEFLREKKRARRSRWMKRMVLFTLLVLGAYFSMEMSTESLTNTLKPHAGLIDVKGTILDEESGSAENFNKAIEKAYLSKGLKALMLRIDSPGGSPVQADYIYNTITHYRKKYKDIKIYAVCVDTCASAAYYIAAAADDIYANPSSIVGSIGVLYNGFGFVDTLQKLGVSRRLQTAGRNKGFLDQFSPTSPAQEQLMQTMLELIHQEFIQKVKTGRGQRLLIDDETFSGLFWTGVQAKQRGLIDGFASTDQLARDTLHLDTIVDYSYKESPFESVAKRIGVTMVNHLPSALGVKEGFR